MTESEERHMDATTDQWNLREGTEVFGSDGSKVGKVIAVHDNYLVVEKGFFFPTDYYVPTSAIANYDGDTVYLNVGKDEALNSNWNVAPVGDTVGTTVTDTYTTDDAGYGVGSVVDADVERF